MPVNSVTDVILLSTGPTGALRAYLEAFAAADDRRTSVEQNPFGEGPIDEMNKDWKYYSHVLKCQMSESILY
nr:hypothetical protein [Tanacetum cinerariifolium]